MENYPECKELRFINDHIDLFQGLQLVHEWMNKQLNTKNTFIFIQMVNASNTMKLPSTDSLLNFVRQQRLTKTLLHIYDTYEECSGRVVDLRSKGHRFETHRRHRVVILSKTLYHLHNTCLT